MMPAQTKTEVIPSMNNANWKAVSTRLIAAGMALTLWGAGHAVAQQAIGVEPPVMLHTAVPGQSITFNLKIGNPSPKSIKVRAALGDWNYSQAGELQYFAPGKVPSSASPWVRLSDTIVDLPGSGVQTIRYTITVPKDAAPGSHWGGIYFTAEAGEALEGPLGAAFSARVAHTFYVNIAPTRSSGRIAGIFGKPSVPATKSYSLVMQYVNTGNVAQQLEGRVEIRNASGKMVAVTLIKLQVVLPGATRILQVSLSGPLPAGDYTALAILNYGDKGKDIAGEYTFTLKQPLLESP